MRSLSAVRRRVESLARESVAEVASGQLIAVLWAGRRRAARGESQRCLYCGCGATVGACEPEAECCNHAVTCPTCGKSSVLSVSLPCSIADRRASWDARFPTDTALSVSRAIPVALRGRFAAGLARVLRGAVRSV